MRRWQAHWVGQSAVQAATAGTCPRRIARAFKSHQTYSEAGKPRRGSSIGEVRSDAITTLPISSPPVYKVRTEGFGPSEDLVKGVQPRSHLFVEAAGLHPNDYEVQKRVLELTMPSLSGVTVQSVEPTLGSTEGVPLPSSTSPLQAEVREELLQRAWEEQMVSVANIIIEQVERRTGLQMESLRASQDEQHRTTSEIVIQTVKDELWKATEAIRGVTHPQQNEPSENTALLIQEISDRITHEIMTHHETLVQTVTSLTHTHTIEQANTTIQLVTSINERIEKYFKKVEAQLMEISRGVQDTAEISAVAAAALEPSKSVMPEDAEDTVKVHGPPMEEQKMNEIHMSIVTAIEKSSQTQLEKMSTVVSDIVQEQQRALESLRRETPEENSARPAPVDFTPLEDFIEGSLRTATDAIRQEVVGEVKRLVTKGGRNGSLTSQQQEAALQISDRMDEVLRESQHLTAVVASIDEVSSDLLKGQTKTLDVVESIKTLLAAQQESLQMLQKDVRSSALPSPQSDSTASLTTMTEERLAFLSQQQTELHALTKEALASLNTRDEKIEAQLAGAMETISDYLSSTVEELSKKAEMSLAEGLEGLKQPHPGNEDQFVVKQQEFIGKKLTDLHAALSTYQTSVGHMMERMTVKSEQQFMEVNAKLTSSLEADRNREPALSSEDIRSVVQEVLRPHAQEVLGQIQAQSESVAATSQLRATLEAGQQASLVEQHMISLASSLTEAVSAALQDMKHEAAEQQKELRTLLVTRAEEETTLPAHGSESSSHLPPPPTPVSPEFVEDRLEALKAELFSTVREEMGKTHEVDLTPMYKYVDSMLLFVREQLSSHQASSEEQVEKVHTAVRAVLNELPSKTAVLQLEDSVARKLEEQSKQLEALLQASAAIAEELSRTNSSPKAEEDGVSTLLKEMKNAINEIPTKLSAQQEVVTSSVAAKITELQAHTADSMAKLQQQISSLPSVEDMQRQLEAATDVMVTNTQQALEVALANAVHLSPTENHSAQETATPEAAPGIEAVEMSLRKVADEHADNVLSELRQLQDSSSTKQAELLQAIERLESSETVQKEIQSLGEAISASMEQLDQDTVVKKLTGLESSIETFHQSQKRDVETLKGAIEAGLKSFQERATPTSQSTVTSVEGEELYKRTSHVLQQVMQQLEQQQAVLTSLATTAAQMDTGKSQTGDAVSPPSASTVLHDEAARLEHQVLHTAALEALQMSAERVEEQLHTLQSGLEPAARNETEASLKQVREHLAEVEKCTAQLVEGQRFQEGQLEVVAQAVRARAESSGLDEAKRLEDREIWRHQLAQACESTKENLRSATGVIVDGTSEVVQMTVKPLQKSLDILERKLEDLTSSAASAAPPRVVESTDSQEVVSGVRQLLSDAEKLRGSFRQATEDHQKTLEHLSQTLTGSLEAIKKDHEARTSSDVTEVRAKVEELLRQLETSTAVGKEDIQLAARTISSRVEALSDTTMTSLEKLHETVAQSTADMKECVTATVSRELVSYSSGRAREMTEGVERLLKAQATSTEDTRKAVKNELSELPEAIAKTLNNSVQSMTSETLRQLKRLEENIHAVRSAEVRLGTQASAPVTSGSFSLRSFGWFIAQTVALCVTILLCFYYAIAALLIAAVPKLPTVRETYHESQNRRKARRVADQVL